MGSHWLFAPEKNGKSCQAQSKVKHKVIIGYVQLACHPASQPYFSLKKNQHLTAKHSHWRYDELMIRLFEHGVIISLAFEYLLCACATHTKVSEESVYSNILDSVCVTDRHRPLFSFFSREKGREICLEKSVGPAESRFAKGKPPQL